MTDLPLRTALRVLSSAGSLVSDRTALKIIYRLSLGRFPDLDNPRTFNEKLQWLKINYRPEKIHLFADKSAAKAIAASRSAEVRTIPTLRLWHSAEEIDLDSLPAGFILKPTHGGGGNVRICRNKMKPSDKKKCLRWCAEALKSNIYARYREFPYRDIIPAIIAEPLLDGAGELPDYKFFCFDGEPRFLKVDTGRFSRHHADYFDLSFNPLPFGESSYPPSPTPVLPPPSFQKMIRIAKDLSAGFPFVRIDLYDWNGEVYFGEFTFYPRSGFGKFHPSDADLLLGEMLRLPTP